MMGGCVYRDLNVSVSHLIAGEVGSKKYLVAASLKKPILLPSWVKALWEKSQQRYIITTISCSVYLNLLFYTDHINVHLFIKGNWLQRCEHGGILVSSFPWLHHLCNRVKQSG